MWQWQGAALRSSVALSLHRMFTSSRSRFREPWTVVPHCVHTRTVVSFHFNKPRNDSILLQLFQIKTDYSILSLRYYQPTFLSIQLFHTFLVLFIMNGCVHYWTYSCNPLFQYSDEIITFSEILYNPPRHYFSTNNSFHLQWKREYPVRFPPVISPTLWDWIEWK